MRVRRLLAAAGFLLALSGCSSSPTQPTVPTTPLSSLTLSPATDTLHVGDTSAFTVVAVDTSGATLANPSLTWSTSNGAVFTVSNTGVVTGRGEGTALLRVASGGKADTSTVVVLPLQRGWYKLTSNSGFNLNGVFFQPDGNSGWAVGAAGQILVTRNAGVTWSVQTSATGFPLNAVWFTSAAEGWVAGSNGTILHTLDGGDDWNPSPSGSSDILYGITFATRDTGWAVGGNGTVLRTVDRGVTWTKLNPTTYALRSVSFLGTRHGWAVGDNGVIIGTHDRGNSWFVVLPSITSQSLRGVWRSSLASTFATGDFGSMPRTSTTPDSVAWEYTTIGASNQLSGIHFIDTTYGWAVGDNGTRGLIVATDDGGDTWTPQSATSLDRFNAVWFVDANRGWAVGDKGTIFHTATGGQP